MKFLKIFAIASLSLTTIGAHQVIASETTANQTPRILTLTGVGEVKSAPDMAVINLGVIRQANTARNAVSANNAAMSQIIATVRAAGVAEKDIQTSRFSLRPLYIHYPRKKNQPQRPPTISGYSVSNNLAVTVRDLNRVGSVLDAVVSAGSNQIGGISFSIQNPKPLRDQARRKAVKSAIDKANLYAAAAGVKLGSIKSISEQGGHRPPRPVYRQALQAKSFAVSAVPIARGEQSLTIKVNIVWEIQ